MRKELRSARGATAVILAVPVGEHTDRTLRKVSVGAAILDRWDRSTTSWSSVAARPAARWPGGSPRPARAGCSSWRPGRSAGCRRSSTSPRSPPACRATRPTGRTRSSCAPEAPPTIPRGRVLGGSGAVNGAVWMRATPADGWGLPGWTWADMLAALRPVRGGRRSRRPARPRRRRPRAGRPPCRRAAATPPPSGSSPPPRPAGFPAEPDKNAGGAPGRGAGAGQRRRRRAGQPGDGLPDGALGSRRAAAATGGPRRRRRTGAAHRPRRQPGRARPARRPAAPSAYGCVDGTTVHAGEVVLAAGAVGTPHLLLRSGIGPADDLRAAGIEVRARPARCRSRLHRPSRRLPALHHR